LNTKAHYKAARDPRLNDKTLKNELRDTVKPKIIDSIQQEAFDWVLTQPLDRYEALPKDSGQFALFSVILIVERKVSTSA
jgi:hypothetical protein